MYIYVTRNSVVLPIHQLTFDRNISTDIKHPAGLSAIEGI